MYGRIWVGWLVHVIRCHYVHAEPRSKFWGGGVHLPPCPMRATWLFHMMVVVTLSFCMHMVFCTALCMDCYSQRLADCHKKRLEYSEATVYIRQVESNPTSTAAVRRPRCPVWGVEGCHALCQVFNCPLEWCTSSLSAAAIIT